MISSLCAASFACVPLTPSPPEGAPPELAGADPGAPLGAGSKRAASLHFDVYAYETSVAEAISLEVERLYTKIMTDTGLYSFRPRELYPIVIYKTQEEYLSKTGLPAWSSGAARGRTIYTFEGDHAAGVLAHEMTHLIFFEFMGRSNHDTLWVNEGLAVYEEEQAAFDAAGTRFGGVPLPFEEMMRIVPIGEEQRKVSVWYRQVGSVVRYMVERGGGLGFAVFLKALRDGMTLDAAVRAGFPGRWADLAALESSWRAGR